MEDSGGQARGIKFIAPLSLSVAIYSMIGWLYVAVCALVAPNTLGLPLTHLVPFLREDTSGFISFLISFVSFTTYLLINNYKQSSQKLEKPGTCQ